MHFSSFRNNHQLKCHRSKQSLRHGTPVFHTSEMHLKPFLCSVRSVCNLADIIAVYKRSERFYIVGIETATRPPPTTWWRWRCRSSPRCPRPLLSFGQGSRGRSRSCWPTPSPRPPVSIRQATDRGTINCNTNGSLPRRVEQIARAGLDSIRISLNGAGPSVHFVLPCPAPIAGQDVREGDPGGQGVWPVHHAQLPRLPRRDRPGGGAGRLPGPHPRDARRHGPDAEPEHRPRAVSPHRAARPREMRRSSARCAGPSDASFPRSRSATSTAPRSSSEPASARRWFSETIRVRRRMRGTAFVFSAGHVYGSCRAFRGA